LAADEWPKQLHLNTASVISLLWTNGLIALDRLCYRNKSMFMFAIRSFGSAVEIAWLLATHRRVKAMRGHRKSCIEVSSVPSLATLLVDFRAIAAAIGSSCFNQVN